MKKILLTICLHVQISYCMQVSTNPITNSSAALKAFSDLESQEAELRKYLLLTAVQSLRSIFPVSPESHAFKYYILFMHMRETVFAQHQATWGEKPENYLYSPKSFQRYINQQNKNNNYTQEWLQKVTSTYACQSQE